VGGTDGDFTAFIRGEFLCIRPAGTKKPGGDESAGREYDADNEKDEDVAEFCEHMIFSIDDVLYTNTLKQHCVEKCG
jgi:hypothetical protein